MLLQRYHNRPAERHVSGQKCWYYSCHTRYSLTDHFVKLLQHVNKSCLENCTSIRHIKITAQSRQRRHSKRNTKYKIGWKYIFGLHIDCLIHILCVKDFWMLQCCALFDICWFSYTHKWFAALNGEEIQWLLPCPSAYVSRMHSVW